MPTHSRDEDSEEKEPAKEYVTRAKKKARETTTPRGKRKEESVSFVVSDKEPGRNNVHLIQGYTGHLKDPVYIKMMHARLNVKLKVLTDSLIHMTEKFSNIENRVEPDAIHKIRRKVIEPLCKVQERIEKLQDCLILSLKKDALGAALDIGNDKGILELVSKICNTKQYTGRYTYLYDTNTVHCSFQLDGERFKFILD